MITYSATLDVADELALYLSGLLTDERRRRGTAIGRRALSTFHQAVMGLRWFRDRTAIPALARDNNISRATGYRYIDEVIDVLANKAPDLHQALLTAKNDGARYVILDGTLLPCDRLGEKTTSVTGTEIDRWYSGKHRQHGGTIQALTTPEGFPIWVSPVEPGSVHDITAAENHALGALYWAASQLDLPTLADGGYHGTGAGVHTIIKRSKAAHVLGSPLNTDHRTHNPLQRSLRALGERGFALLTQRWRTLQRITASPRKTGHIAQAALVLTHHEHGRIH
ncbi:transposase family protein [Saccharopolyspora hirsuta]|uniref:transposase family protein n=1 Tax=Saccharopolyspora hirsuta TaxID=1837 RepID=UPI00331E12F6